MTTIKVRRDTSANWVSLNPVLNQGEPGLETDTGRFKYGDGSTAWTSLGYAAQQLTPTTQTTTYTAKPGDYVKADISSTSWTLTLPSTPAANTIIGAKVIAQVASGAPNTLTVACAGSDHFEQSGGATSTILSLLDQAAAWQYNGGYWTRLSDDLPLGQLGYLYANVFSPMAYGAAGNGTTDDTTAVKAAFAAAIAVGGTVDLGVRKFLTSSAVTLGSGVTITGDCPLGNSAASGTITNNTSDIFTVGSVSSVEIRNCGLIASAGHVFNAATGSCSFWKITGTYVSQTSTSHAIWYMNNGTAYIDMLVGDGCSFAASGSATVPPWYVISAGGNNCNTWRRMRVNNNSNTSEPFFYVENTYTGAGGQFAADNVFSDLTCELCTGGIIKALSVSNLTISNVGGYDTSYSSDVFHVATSTTALTPSNNIMVRNSGRRDDTLSGGANDFYASSDTTGIILENVGGGSPVYSYPQAQTTIIGGALYPVSAVPQIIATQTLASAATITFSSIPQGFTNLRLLVIGRSADATEADYWYVQFNGDTSNSYDLVEVYGTSSAAAAADHSGQPGFFLTVVDGDLPGTSATAGVVGMLDLEIPLYSGTAFQKIVSWKSGYNDAATSAADSLIVQAVGSWRHSSAITSIKVSAALDASMTIGTTAILYAT